MSLFQDTSRSEVLFPTGMLCWLQTDEIHQLLKSNGNYLRLICKLGGTPNQSDYSSSQGRPSFVMPKDTPSCPSPTSSSCPNSHACASHLGCCSATLALSRPQPRNQHDPRQNQHQQKHLTSPRKNQKTQYRISDTYDTSSRLSHRGRP